MLAYTPVTLKLSDHPIYAIQALAMGPRQMLVAAAGDKLWVYLVRLADDDHTRHKPQRTRASNLHTQLLVEWTPVDLVSSTDVDPESDEVDPCGRRADASGCAFQAGFLIPDHPPLASAGHGGGRRRRANESLYTLCLFTFPATYTGPLGAPGHIVCVTGGHAGYLHVFNVHLQAHVRVVRAGIGGDVNDIQAYPGRPEWVLVACKDRTVRIVDLHLGRSVLVMGGVDGHQGQVLCASVHPSGRWVVSGGADCAVRVWRVPDRVGEGEGGEVRMDRCTWWTQWPHANYVDGVAFVGDEDEDGGMSVVSKSVDGEAVVWRVETRPLADMVIEAVEVDGGEANGDRPSWATHSELNADVEACPGTFSEVCLEVDLIFSTLNRNEAHARPYSPS
ncbi:WD40-repeat-containing domain protein [Catenaria anguillulae PL171]|uniref:WD40-repeat-containing domain protein n=1 Tax=Catenaria anguillulae PL171 TaxID=765915 RepID=A0A1Y2HK32_9FUNG|nr:WD40-repeat-containing domain protein [Catenaria anguillulae PL171]